MLPRYSKRLSYVIVLNAAADYLTHSAAGGETVSEVLTRCYIPLRVHIVDFDGDVMVYAGHGYLSRSPRESTKRVG